MKLSIETSTLEVEKPSGGGHGPRVLYTISVLLDGEVALFLTRTNFKQTGQMEAFAEVMETLERKQ